LLIWLIIEIVETGFKGKPAETKVLRVVKVLSMDVVIVLGQERLSKLQRRKSKIDSNNNLLRYSKGEETSYCVKKKEEEDKIRERKDSLYRDPSQVIELRRYE